MPNEKSTSATELEADLSDLLKAVGHVQEIYARAPGAAHGSPYLHSPSSEAEDKTQPPVTKQGK